MTPDKQMISIPNSVTRIEMFKDGQGVWCASLNYQDDYGKGSTPEEAFNNAFKNIEICIFTNKTKNCKECSYPALCD